MQDSGLKLIFGSFILIFLFFFLFLLSIVARIPKTNISNWEECTGTIISVDNNNNYLISYDENGNTHYFVKYSTIASSSTNTSAEFEENDTIKLFYYKANPTKVSEQAPESISMDIILWAIGLIIFIALYYYIFRIFHKPKNGIKEHLKLVSKTNPNSTTGYVLLWEKDGKQKYLSAPNGLNLVGDILEITNISNIICYIKSEHSRTCYADIDETFEENNMVISSSNYEFKI